MTDNIDAEMFVADDGDFDISAMMVTAAPVAAAPMQMSNPFALDAAVDLDFHVPAMTHIAVEPHVMLDASLWESDVSYDDSGHHLADFHHAQ